MDRFKPRKSRARYCTPPPELYTKEGHANTPQRTAVIVAKCISQAINTPIPQSLIRDLTNLPERTHTRIVTEKKFECSTIDKILTQTHAAQRELSNGPTERMEVEEQERRIRDRSRYICQDGNLD